MKMKRLIIELCCAIALVACGNSQESKAGEEDLRAKSLLQGIWIEDETELPLMRIEGCHHLLRLRCSFGRRNG